jgi:hypothetical protein
MVTADEIREKLATDQQWLERGIVAIYSKQTQEEKAAKGTIHDNGVGFNGCDGGYGAYLAKYILGGNVLSGRHLESGRKMMLKYAGQLFRIAQANNTN